MCIGCNDLLDRLVGAGEQHRRHFQANRLRHDQATRSNLVGCPTGRSAGFAPRKILSTKSLARR
jgi:hypothetical protein